MLKEDVIKLRTALKCGKNIPLRILINNSFTIIDESSKFQFTKWDDTNGMLYSFRMVDMQTDTLPNNKGNCISFFVVSYDTIEAIEIAQLPVGELDNLFSSLGAIGCTFNEDFKNLIKRTYTEIFHPDRYQLSPSDTNTILGPGAVNDRDDYYYGKYEEPFLETKRYNDRNNYISNGD